MSAHEEGFSGDRWALPPDPFADDPNDPAQEMGELHAPDPVTEQERAELQEYLLAVEHFRARMTPHGFAGLRTWCPDCEEEHLDSWEAILTNCRAALAGESPIYAEPNLNATEEQFCSEDYARGFCLGYRRGRISHAAYVSRNLPQFLADFAHHHSHDHD